MWWCWEDTIYLKGERSNKTVTKMMCDEMIFYFLFPHSPVEMNTIPKDSQELNKGIIEDLRGKKNYDF